MTRSCAAAAALVLLAVTTGRAGQDPRPPDASGSFSATTTAILVDVVVRDRRGRPVTGLSAADFEIREDGVPQRIDSFSRVVRGGGIGVGIAWKEGAPPITVTADGRPAAPAPEGESPLETSTALVFDHLSSESLRLAQRASLHYLPMTGEARSRTAVFATDPGVRVLQTYTTDPALIRRAVSAVLPSGTSAEELKAERRDELVGRKRDLEGDVQAAVAGAVGGSTAAVARNAAELGRRETELRLVQTELNMIRSFDNMDRDHRGYDTAAGLMSVVRSLADVPGRKTIVFFSEGLPVSPALSARLDLAIEAANRANVTVYAVDANGLRAKSGLASVRKEMDAFVEERFGQIASGTDRTEQPLTMAFERVQDTLLLDSRTGLARLAEETGGFLVEQSNDLSSAFRRIDEDNRFHYLLTYSPANTVFDGRFRTIRVAVRQPALQVFARRGYRATPKPAAIDAGGYETPALGLLDRTPLPNAFPVHAAGFSFPEPQRPGLTPVLVQVSTAVLRYDVDGGQSGYTGRAAIVVRLRDGRGRDVQKLSQQYVLTGEASDLEAAKRGRILFYREVELPPGVYTMETIVYDAVADQGSARVATLTVPAAGPGPGLSSLVLVDRIEEVRDGPPAGTGPPLYVGSRLLYPSLGEPIRRSAADVLPFYFTLYGDLSGAAAEMQLLQNGRPVAGVPLQLSPQTGTRTPHLGRLPIAGLPAGTYELRIRVTTPAGEQARTAYFTLQD